MTDQDSNSQGSAIAGSSQPACSVCWGTGNEETFPGKADVCSLCGGTGWYGDHGPGINGNSEYTQCMECDRKPMPMTYMEKLRARKVEKWLLHLIAGDDDARENLARHCDLLAQELRSNLEPND